jgi:glucose/arabinose dehydrogenase
MIARFRVAVSRHAAPALWLAVGLAACGKQDAPVEVVANASPALQLVTSGLDLPLLVTAPPSDSARLFVVEQSGRIRVVRHDTLVGVPFLDLSTAISCCGERGLLGLAFHSQYATNGFFFVSYTNPAGDTRVLRYHVSADPERATATAADTVLSQAQPFSNHNGGNLAFGPDGYLYFGLGDGGSGGDPLGNGQNTATLLGKLLRIDVSSMPYTVPATNPFVGQAGVRPEIWAVGLRNPWRFSFDRLTGALYIADVGQSAREEIDVEAAGAGGRNYGWSTMEGMICYVAGCSTAGLTLPVHDYTHSDGCSVTGGYVYRGTRVPALAGLYLYSDYCSGWVRSFAWLNGTASDHRDWPSLAPGGNISSFGEDARGELYVVQYTPGAVFRIVPAVTVP